jgi:hypothetical protein
VVDPLILLLDGFEQLQNKTLPLAYQLRQRFPFLQTIVATCESGYASELEIEECFGKHVTLTIKPFNTQQIL